MLEKILSSSIFYILLFLLVVIISLILFNLLSNVNNLKRSINYNNNIINNINTKNQEITSKIEYLSMKKGLYFDQVNKALKIKTYINFLKIFSLKFIAYQKVQLINIFQMYLVILLKYFYSHNFY